MAYESLLVYRIVQGDTVPLHNGNFRVEEAGSVLILEANNFEDDIIGDLTHTGGTDVTDQVVVSSNVTGINAGDFSIQDISTISTEPATQTPKSISLQPIRS